MGNDQSADKPGGSLQKVADVFRVTGAGDVQARQEGSFGILDSLPQVRPLVEDDGSTPPVLLSSVVTSMLTAPRLPGTAKSTVEEGTLQRAMSGLALSTEDAQLSERQYDVLTRLNGLLDQLTSIRTGQRVHVSAASDVSESLREVDRLTMTVADVQGEVEELGRQLSRVTAHLPQDDPLRSFSTFLEARRASEGPEA